MITEPQFFRAKYEGEWTIVCLWASDGDYYLPGMEYGYPASYFDLIIPEPISPTPEVIKTIPAP